MTNHQMPMAEYFVDFGARLARLVHAQGVEIEPPTVRSRVASEVLELAGTVAHTSDRKFAPIAAFAAGIAVGQLRAAGRPMSDTDTAAFVAELRAELEAAVARETSDGK